MRGFERSPIPSKKNT